MAFPVCCSPEVTGSQASPWMSTAESAPLGAAESTQSAVSQAEMASWRATSTEVTWRVSMQLNQGARIGMRVGQAKGRDALVVNRLWEEEESAIWSWNTTNPGEQIRCGDLIIEVNGTSGCTSDLEHALTHCNQRVELLVGRLVEFGVGVNLEDAPHGIELSEDLVVTSVLSTSATKMQNKVISPELRVLPGDRIVAVNCQRTEAAMREQLAKASYIDLVLHRPALGELPASASSSSETRPSATTVTTTRVESRRTSSPEAERWSKWRLAVPAAVMNGPWLSPRRASPRRPRAEPQMPLLA